MSDDQYIPTTADLRTWGWIPLLLIMAVAVGAPVGLAMVPRIILVALLGISIAILYRDF